MNPPLAEQLRPKSLEEYIGQSHLMGPEAVLHKAILSGNLPSMILWGPPGVGKTTLASLISRYLNRPFFTLSAVMSGVKEVREVLEKAENFQRKQTKGGTSPSLFEDSLSKQDSLSIHANSPQSLDKDKATPTRPILFIDEIHRFSKSQQDSLLGAVEKGIITFIGATTENPSFEVIAPLLSRCQVYTLNPLSSSEMDILLERATHYVSNAYGRELIITESQALKRISGGDGRKLLNAFELVAEECLQNSQKPQQETNGHRVEKEGIRITHDDVKSDIKRNGKVIIDNATVNRLIQQNLAVYDKNGENHYDIISAFIKSIRGCDPNAAVYYLARMLSGGEDAKFIARRMVILASEDIGNANPNALLLANACFDTVHKIGYPECRITLSQTAIYLACSPKSNASYMAIDQALDFVRKTGDLPVPLHLRNAPTQLMQDLGYKDGYLYAHDFEGNFAYQEFLPEKISGTRFYVPGQNPKENDMRKHLRILWKDKYGY